MLPTRFNFGDPDEPKPQRKNSGFARILAFAVVVALAALAQALDLGRLLR
jgi:hypothetical protein